MPKDIMSSKRAKGFLGLESNEGYFGSNSPRTYDRRFIPHTWNAFQRMRQENSQHSSVTARPKENREVTVAQEAPIWEETLKHSSFTSQTSKKPFQSNGKLKPLRHSVKNDRWARSWANHRVHQALILRDTRERSKSCETETKSVEKTENIKITRSRSVRSRNIELDAKAAEVFERLRSIYVNNEERGKRLQCIRERMNEFQKQTIRKEVNKSIQEFHTRLKEDERNRKELRRVREKYSETKRTRLRNMHVSKNALEVPAVSRLAYGLPQEGKEFSATLSAKKTTDEIKKMWRMAILRKNCIDSFLNKVSQQHDDLPYITVKTPRSSSVNLDSSPTHELSPRTDPGNDRSKELTSKSETKDSYQQLTKLNSLVKIQTAGILDTFESLSSEEEDFEK